MGTRITGLTGVTDRTHPHIFRLNREKPDPEKTGAFYLDPPGKFPNEPEKPPEFTFLFRNYFLKKSTENDSRRLG